MISQWCQIQRSTKQKAHRITLRKDSTFLVSCSLQHTRYASMGKFKHRSEKKRGSITRRGYVQIHTISCRRWPPHIDNFKDGLRRAIDEFTAEFEKKCKEFKLPEYFSDELIDKISDYLYLNHQKQGGRGSHFTFKLPYLVPINVLPQFLRMDVIIDTWIALQYAQLMINKKNLFDILGII